MTDKIKPMLSCDIEIDDLKFPLYASVKYDGIRCIIINGVAYSRSLKPIRNRYIQSVLGKPEYNGLDGELIVGDIYAKDVFQMTTSGVMSESGEPHFTYYVFDKVDVPHLPYSERLKMLDEYTGIEHIVVSEQVLCNAKEEVQELLDKESAMGGEGLITKYYSGEYKYGRSTTKQQLSCKLKFFNQDEFEVVGFEERYSNQNEATINELGYTERSSHKDNLVPMNTLGSLTLKYGGDTFKCGTGFNDAQRKEIWNNKDKYLGKLASIRYMSVGQKSLPRVPSFIGWRDLDDMS